MSRLGLEDSPLIPDKARVQSNGFYDYRCTDPSPDGLDSAFRFPMSIQYAAPIGRYYVISTDLLPENNLQWSYFDYQDLPSRQGSLFYMETWAFCVGVVGIPTKVLIHKIHRLVLPEMDLKYLIPLVLNGKTFPLITA